MSHISTTTEIPIKLDWIAKAIERFPELEMVRQAKFRSWATEHGRLVGDSPIPDGFTEADFVNGCAEYIIRIKNNDQAYEIGVVRRRDGQDGFQLMYDGWQGGYGLESVCGAELANIKQAYNEEETAAAMEAEGWCVSRVPVEGGMQLVAERW